MSSQPLLPEPCPHPERGTGWLCGPCMDTFMHENARALSMGDPEREEQLLAIFEKAREMASEVRPDDDFMEHAHRFGVVAVEMGLFDGFSQEVMEGAYCHAVELIEWPDGVEDPS